MNFISHSILHRYTVRSLIYLTLFILLGLFANSSWALPNGANPNDYELIMEDHFDYVDEQGTATVDPLYWNVVDQNGFIGNDNRGAAKDPAAVEVTNDGNGNHHLIIKAFTDNSGAHFSGAVQSNDKFVSAFGYYEASIRWDKITPGTAGAFWLMPGSTPGTLAETGAEIDIIEYRAERYGRYYADGFGNNSGTIVPLDDTLHFGLHWDGYGNKQNSIWGAKFPKGRGNSLMDNQFHIYGLLWTPFEYVVYFNGTEIYRAPRPFVDYTAGLPLDVVDPVFELPGSPGNYYEGDLAGTSPNEGWLSSDNNSSTLIDFYFPDSMRIKTDQKVSYENGVTKALQHLIFSIEVRAEGNRARFDDAQDGWIGDIPLGGFGPLDNPDNCKMTVDWVRVYDLKSLRDPQSPSNANDLTNPIQAEDVDTGGQHVAFFDRSDSGGTGIDTGSFPAGGGTYLITAKNEWLEYTLQPSQPAYYAITFDASHPLDPTTIVDNPNTTPDEGDSSWYRSGIQLLIDNLALGQTAVELSTDININDKKRTYLAPAIARLDSGNIMQVQFVNSDEVYLDQFEFHNLGQSVVFRSAPEAATSGDVSVNGSYLTGFNGSDNGQPNTFIHGEAVFSDMDLAHWDQHPAKLFISYSGAYNSNKFPIITLDVNGHLSTVDLNIPDDDYVKTGDQRKVYNLKQLTIPAAHLLPAGNVIKLLANNINNQNARISWIALGAEIPETPPSAPNTFTAVAASTTEIDLAWNDTSTTEDSFEIQYREQGGTYSLVSVEPANTTAIQVAGLNPDTTYQFRVRAANDNGTSGWSNMASTTTDSSSGGGSPIQIEAEDGVLVGQSIIGSHSNASGPNNEYVDRLNKSNSGILINAPTAPVGTATLTIAYATNSTNVEKTVTVNGVNVEVVSLPTTGSNNNFTGMLTLAQPITMQGDGTDQIQIWRDNTSGNLGSVRIDYILITPSASAVDIHLEAEDGTLVDGAELGSDSNASGPNNEYVTKLNIFNAGVVLNLPTAPAGVFDLTLSYANGSGTAQKTVTVNGVNVEVVDFVTTGGNKNFSDVTLNTQINLLGDGNDSIKIWRDGSNGNTGAIRLDYITIHN